MPGGKYCCVYECGSNTKEKNEKTFFSLPTDPEKLALWLSLIGREDLLGKTRNGKLINQRICSDHFSEKHFHFVKHLRRDAVPHLRLPNITSLEELFAGPSSVIQDSLNSKKKDEKSTSTCPNEITSAASEANNIEGDHTNKSACTSNVQTPLCLTTKTLRKRKLKIRLTTSKKKIKLLEKKVENSTNKSIT